MDKDVILNKLDSLFRCVARIEEKSPETLEVLNSDYDVQDIIVLNLERAIQTCVDIGLHIISSQNIPAPDSMKNTFYALEQIGYINGHTAKRMAKAVGFRNTAVHAYQEIDWDIVFAIITSHLDDFRDFAREIGEHLN